MKAVTALARTLLTVSVLAAPAAAQTDVNPEVVGSKVAESTTAAAAPDPFATGARASFQDFLNFFSAAVDGVNQSDDGRSLTIRLVPIQEGPLALAGSVTLQKPVVYATLEKALSADLQSSVKDAFDDTDDATYSLSISPIQPACNFKKTSTCFGRSIDRYRSLFDEGLSTKVSLRLGFQPNDPDRVAKIQKAIDTLAVLIDRQPQFAITALRRVTARAIGPSETGASAEFAAGSCNLNRALAEAHRTNSSNVLDGLAGQLVDATGGSCLIDRFVLSATYKHRDAFEGTWFSGALGNDVAAALSEKSTTSFSVKAQATLVPAARASPRNTKIDLAFELERQFQDSIRTKSRAIVSGTLSVPLGESITIPLTITWANKPEFLADVRTRFSTRIGLSYRLPWEKK